jgi:hypothetical protein
MLPDGRLWITVKLTKFGVGIISFSVGLFLGQHLMFYIMDVENMNKNHLADLKNTFYAACLIGAKINGEITDKTVTECKSHTNEYVNSVASFFKD